MKKYRFLYLSLPFLFAACQQQPQGPTQAEYDALRSANDSLSSQVFELQDMIGSVTTCLDSIDQQESILFVNNDDGSKPTKKQLLERMNNYRELLNRQREELARLEKLDRSNRGSIRELKNIIAKLREDIQAKEQRINELETELTAKNQNIAQLNQSLNVAQETTARVSVQRDSLQQVASQQSDAMHKAYYIIATKSELKRAGITSGFLGKKINYATLNTAGFEQIDTRTFTKVTIPGRGVKMMPDRPSGSYMIYERSTGNTVLEILEPERFWQTSPYLILQRR